MSNYVLDASALLALLQQEPGKEAVAAALHNASVSTVNSVGSRILVERKELSLALLKM